MSDSLPERWAGAVLEALGPEDGDAWLARLRLVEPALREALGVVHPDGGEALLDRLLEVALAAASARPEPLRRLDRRREIDPGWFLRPEMVGYVAYADRFAGELGGVRGRLDHLSSLGVRYLHLMPLLAPREGENDGGYAVASYEQVDPRLGTMADLEALAADLHERDIALCIDFVLNHTADTHPWALAARAGDERYRSFYRFFDDREGPDRYERSLVDVFPATAPGSFTYLPDADAWVWTTFHDYQWDLDWSNPDVLVEMLATLLRLGNRGVDVLRLDAVPFLWKREGTVCQGEPEAHRLLQVLRALSRVAAPGLLLKAEAIVGPDELVRYLGGHEPVRAECDLAYDNQLMVMLWSTLATRDTRLAVAALGRRRRPPAGTGWVTYVRCHDDIGWAVADEDARAVGLDPEAHRRFLADFYAGRHPGSFARGLDFQPDPVTGAVRTSGSAASLAGLEQAVVRGDARGIAAAVDRLHLLHAIAFTLGGIPLVYMGDELALPNDLAWADEPGHRDDNRWIHRPRFPWADLAELREGAAGRVERGLRDLVALRARSASLRGDADLRFLDTGDPRLLAFVRHHPTAHPVLVVGCFSDTPVPLPTRLLDEAGVVGAPVLHASAPLADAHLAPWHVLVVGRPD